MAQYDEIVKHLLQRFADEFARLFFGTADVKVLETLDTEQPMIKVHRNDMTFKVQRQGEEVLLHIEVQTEDSRDKPMPLRVLSYTSELLLRYELPVYSVVLYLSPNAGKTDPGGYSYGDNLFGLNHRYQVIRLEDLDGESFLETAPVGLLPFTPLMEPPAGVETEAWLQKCVEKTVSAPVDKKTRGTLLLALSTLGSLKYGTTLFEKLILEEMMQESPFYEIIMNRGIEQGKEIGIEQGKEIGIEQGIEQGKEIGLREMSITNTLSVLTKRFPQQDMQPIRQALESILDLDRLTELHLMAIDTPSVEAFLRRMNG